MNKYLKYLLFCIISLIVTVVLYFVIFKNALKADETVYVGSAVLVAILFGLISSLTGTKRRRDNFDPFNTL